MSTPPAALALFLPRGPPAGPRGCGDAAWLALTHGQSPVGVRHLPAELQLLGAVTTAGAAMISDWDYPRATAIATAAASIHVPIAGHVYTPGQGVIAAFVAAVAAKALRLLPNRGWRAAWALGILVAVSATVLSDGLWWIPASVAVGVSVHILGDALTNNGVALLWPLSPEPPARLWWWQSSGRFRLPLLGRTGSWREWAFVSVVTAFTVVRAVRLVPLAARGAALF